MNQVACCGMSAAERQDWQAQSGELAQAWCELAESGASPEAEEAQEMARRHVAWLGGIPGTPAADSPAQLDGYVHNLAQMYVADARFATNYGGTKGAEFVRDALLAYLDSNARN